MADKKLKLPQIELPAVLQDRIDTTTREDAQSLAGQFLMHVVQRGMSKQLTGAEALVNLLGAGLLAAASTELPTKREVDSRRKRRSTDRRAHAARADQKSKTSSEKETPADDDVIDAEYTIVEEKK